VHLASIKHPVVADHTYDGGRLNTIKNAQLRSAISKLNRPFLHAACLSLFHPTTGERMEFTAPLPFELQNFLETIR
jgi:23S rRNA-/tRNA-specific pseudouridylate synthase